jgi:subtilisin family serine protease
MLRKSRVTIGLMACLLVSRAETFGGEAPKQVPPVPRQAAQTPQSRRDRGAYVEDEILVRFKDNASDRGIASAHAMAGTASMKRFRIVNKLELVRLARGISVKDAIKSYLQHPDVLYAEPNYEVHTFAVPNDPQFGQLWGLQNNGQSGGVVDADIDAAEAWNITTGSNSVVIATIDSGIDYNHQDLAANVFRNTADCNNNGIDDDGNGFIDDCFGIDTANNDSDPRDDNGHGSHVAGTIGAVGNNNLGVVGVNWNVGLMACKFLYFFGGGFTSDAIDCLNYVALMKDRGVNIVATNNSWGGDDFSQALLDAIQAHLQRGILFIAAAGNGSSDNDSAPTYPCNYYLPNIICVAATTRTDALALFSNWGKRTVHIGAPGQEILSTTPANTYSIFSGTSMATPHVTGVAALLKAQDPNLQWWMIKNLILAGGDNDPSLASTVTGKRLNATGSLTCSNSVVTTRLKPVQNIVTATVGTPIDLAALNINCANPNGNVAVTVNPGGQTLTLLDNGEGTDQVSNDGIYSGQWIPPEQGVFSLSFPDGELIVEVLANANYSVASTSFNYRTISGTNLNLSDDQVAQITPPFPIRFGGGRFSDLWVNDNGTVSFTGSFPSPPWDNTTIPISRVSTLVAPFWDDLTALPGTAQNVWWGVTGTLPNRELVIEWRDIPNFNCPNTSVKFQVVFFERRSDILFNYADTVFAGGCVSADGTKPDNGGSATVGVQVTENLGTQFSFNTPSLNNNTALLWTLPNSAGSNPPQVDFDGDGKSDVGIYRSGTWFIRGSSDERLITTVWGGAPQDIPVPGDYDGDGKTDIAVYRDGTWFIKRSSDSREPQIVWGGAPQDIPVPGDYDGDGKTDIAVYRDGTWFIRRSSDDRLTTIVWGGAPQDIPVPGDYDGDGKTDIAVYRDGTWFIRRSSDERLITTVLGGATQDIPVPGDYDGDGKTDIALYRDGTWFIFRSSDGRQPVIIWGGAPQDIPVPGDYDGDGKTDIAVYRDGTWFIRRSSDERLTTIVWGGALQDIPLE